MKSRAAIAGHPLHPILVTIPIGLWSFSPVCDLIYHAGWGDDSWKKAAFYCLIGGTVGAIPAIVTGLIDYPLAREPKTARIATFHLVINLIATILIAFSIWMRWDEFVRGHALPNGAPGLSLQALGPGGYHLPPVLISLAAVGLVGISGWLGGELISRYGISVHEDASRKRSSTSESQP